MKIKWIKTNLTPIQKICLAGLFMALAVILQKVVAINYIPVLPFVRVSFCGPALIMFSSVLLGPIYGMLVGIASDLLGYLIFDPRTNPMFIQITLIYAVLGFASYFVFCLVRSITNRKLMLGIEIGTLLLIWGATTAFLITNARVELVFKILVPIISGLLFIGLILFSILFKGKEDNPFISPLHICFASFVCDFFFLLWFGSLMKAWAFGFNIFITIFLCQALVMFVNVVLDTFFISTFQRFTKKYFVEAR
jgi:uncharacterized membrane protein